MDLWYYLNPESFELYLNSDDNYLNITSVIGGNGKVKNLLYLMERHNIYLLEENIFGKIILCTIL